MGRHMRFPISCALLASSLLMLFGWIAAASAQNGKLVVFAAASLKEALDEVNAAYQRDEDQDEGVAKRASQLLVQRIECSFGFSGFGRLRIDGERAVEELAGGGLVAPGDCADPELVERLAPRRISCRSFLVPPDGIVRLAF